MRSKVLGLGFLMTACSTTGAKSGDVRELTATNELELSSASFGPPSSVTVSEFGASYTFSVQPVADPIPAQGAHSSATHVMPDGAVLTFPSENAAPSAGSVSGPSPVTTFFDAGMTSGDPRLGAHSNAQAAPSSGSINQCTAQSPSMDLCTVRGAGYTVYSCPQGFSPTDAACTAIHGRSGSSSENLLCCVRP